MYKAIYFDIDDTILDFTKCCKQAFIETMKKYNISFTEELYTSFVQIDHDLWTKQKQNLLTVQEVLEQRFQLFNNENHIQIPDSDLKQEFQYQLTQTYILEEDGKEVLETLSKNYLLYGASNGIYTMQVHRLKQAGVYEYFQELYVSDMIGYEKPDLHFFQIVLEKAQLKKEEVLFVGDSYEADILGAINAGIDTCWYKPNKQVSMLPTYEITSLKQLISSQKHTFL